MFVKFEKSFSTVRFRIFISMGLFFLVGNIFAADSLDDLNYENDLSVSLLVRIFGPLVPVPLGFYASENILSHLLVYLLPIASMIGVLIASFLVYFSSLSTASQGKILGAQFSGINIPLRLVAGLGFLVPDQYGFPMIQKIFMWFILNGIVLANSLWVQVVDNYQVGNLLNNQKVLTGASTGSDDSGVDRLMRTLFIAAVRAQYEKDSKGLTAIQFQEGIDDLVLDSIPSQPEQEPKPLVFDFSKSENDKEKIEQIALFNSYKAGIINFANQLLGDPLVVAAGRNLFSGKDLDKDMTGVDYDNMFLGSWFFSKKAILKAYLSKADNNTNDEQKKIKNFKEQGWIVAGSYYWPLQSIQQPESNEKSARFVKAVIVDRQDVGKENSRKEKIVGLWNKIVSGGETMSSASQVNNPEAKGYGDLDLDFSFSGVFDKSTDPLLQFVMYCQAKITGLINAVLAVIIGTIPVGIILEMVTPGYIPGAQIATYLGIITVMALMSLISILIAPLAIGALYVPLLPLIIFFSATIGWVVKVIEALVAAPIVAVALMEPTEDDFGRVSQAGMMLLNVTFRPVLMVAGLIFAARIITVALYIVGVTIAYFDTAFSTGNLVFIDSFIWNVSKIGVIITIVQVTAARCFSLIYLLPDKVFSWIGIRPDQSDTKGLIDDVKRGMDDALKQVDGFFKFAAVLQKSLSQSMKMRNG